MKMKDKITITREEFHDKFVKAMGKVASELGADAAVVLPLAMICAKSEMALFREEDNTAKEDTDNSTPFKVGDEVFVIGNEGDRNTVVNQVVTVLKIEYDDACYVTNGDVEQWIYFPNLRKVLN